MASGAIVLLLIAYDLKLVKKSFLLILSMLLQ